MKRTTLIFDMDGTLLDSLDGLLASTNAALTACGYPTRTYEEVRAFVGNGIGKLIERALPADAEEGAYEKCLAAFKEDYQTAMMDGTRPYPGILQLLETVQKEGYAVAVVSNKIESAVKELSDHFFGDLMPVAIGEREGTARKPAPDSGYAALAALGQDKESAVYIGDSEVDLQTAKNSGLPCLSVDWGNRSAEQLRQFGATSISHTAEELLEAIHQLS